MGYVSILSSNILNQSMGGLLAKKVLTDPFPRSKLTLLISPCTNTNSAIYIFTKSNNLLPNATLSSDLTTIPPINVAYYYTLVANNFAVAANSTVNGWIWDLGTVEQRIIHFVLRASLSYITTNLQISSDGTTWTTIGSVAGGANTYATTEIVTVKTFRYIRVQGVNSSTTYTEYSGVQLAFVYSLDNYLAKIIPSTSEFIKREIILNSLYGNDIIAYSVVGGRYTFSAFLTALELTTNKNLEYFDSDVTPIELD